MRRPQADRQKFAARYFAWLIWKRRGTYYADGRGNQPTLGRYSLGTGDWNEAVSQLERLDRHKAVETGKADRSILQTLASTLTLADGRQLYEQHVQRSAVMGGTRPATQKRYRAVLDKFLAFAKSQGLQHWSQVNRTVLDRYAQHLEELGKSYNTVYFELTTLKQINKWLITEGHLPEPCRVQLRLQRDKVSTTYCWTVAEFQAIVQHCQQTPGLHWLGDLCHLLGLTGLRISELAQLRWSDIDLDKQLLTLADESRQAVRSGGTPARTLKNKRNRTLPLHADLLPMLRRMSRHADGRVFHGPLGGKIKPDTVRNILIKQVLKPLESRFPAVEGAKSFREGRLHSFRHFFCSQCANTGVPEQVLKTWLGHADAAMVRRYYHLDPQESQRQMNRVSIPVVTGHPLGVSSSETPETRAPTEPENPAPCNPC